MNEQLSSLMDGEASELELMRLLKSTDMDEELRNTWTRYQLVSALLHKQEVQPVVNLGLANRVAASLDEMPVQGQKTSGSGRSLLRFAVAASVALTVISTVQWQQSRHESQPSMAVAASAAQIAKPDQSLFSSQQIAKSTAPTSVLASRTLSADQMKARQSEQFERYMQYHLERASMDAPRGMVPLAPLAVREGK
ncbi:MAG TPA: sigma-E factor negative regulatory protein [Pseudomonadales bacterium]|nr:sigma-E factor negative regulatory protein [Pseudomonadales bacterium]